MHLETNTDGPDTMAVTMNIRHVVLQHIRGVTQRLNSGHSEYRDTFVCFFSHISSLVHITVTKTFDNQCFFVGSQRLDAEYLLWLPVGSPYYR